nr:MAG TPA: MiaE tRNA-modifying nonheme diiron monooxygenase, ferritin-like diiron-binding domain [Caudoviricetes sp.]
MHEVDSHEVAFLLDQLVVTAICEERSSERFIDDVM